MPKTWSKSTIPLQCSLCPKTPQFSDVSHLLTHISSKSHLSYRFKLQIRAQSEPECRRQLDVFETWYAENGLEDLLSERMAAKNQKKIDVTTKRKRESSGISKKEAKKKQSLAATPAWRAPVPRMHVWSTGENSIQPAPETSAAGLTPSDGYVTPTMKKKIPNFSRHLSPTPLWDGNTDPILLKADETDDDFDLDTSKLKGVFWPGMNLFDSATAEMKRMRNQRKDGSVVAQMRNYAGDVEPIEWVFNADWTFRKIRDLYDDSSDSTTEEDDEEIAPSLKKRRSRKAMTEMSTNVPILRPSTSKVVVSKRTTKSTPRTELMNHSHEDRTGYYRTDMKVDSAARRFIPSLDEDEEFRLTVEDMGQKRRFETFRDAVENSPGRTESPLEERKFEFSRGFMPPPAMNEMHPPRSPLSKPIPTMQSGKENLSAQRLDMRGPSANPTFPPQAFHDQMFNPLFYHHHTHSFSYGDHSASNGDGKVPQSNFFGDFKPMMPSQYHTQTGSHTHSADFDFGRNMNFRM